MLFLFLARLSRERDGEIVCVRERERARKTFHFAWNRLCHHEIRNFSLKKLLMLAHESEGKVFVHISGRRRRTKTFVCLKAVFLTFYTVLLLRSFFLSLSKKKKLNAFLQLQSESL